MSRFEIVMIATGYVLLLSTVANVPERVAFTATSYTLQLVKMFKKKHV